MLPIRSELCSPQQGPRGRFLKVEIHAMTIFAVLMPEQQTDLESKIREVYPNDFYQLSLTQWLISDSGTAADISRKLGIFDPANPQVAVGEAVIFSTSSYHGRAPTPLWDWMRAKLEAAPSRATG
jgi:hypothetical protein